MSQKIFKELGERRRYVEKSDIDLRWRNIDHFRAYWLHMVILSSAIVLGVLPLISENSSLVKSFTLAKLGLLLIILVCVLIVLYFQNVLSRERSLLFDQKEFHEATFSMQQNILNTAKRDGKDEAYLKEIFERTKSAAYFQEQEIVKRHVIGGKFTKTRLLINKYFNPLISYGFAVGVLLVVLSFIWFV